MLFQEIGLAPERLELRGHSPSVEEHLAAYNDVDIALDTFPYTGCTTTADALWMGVPVLTVAGESMVSRQAASVLRGIGCEQWICRDASEMVDQALSLSNDHNQLQQLRLQQRQRVASSELLDHAGLAASLEGTFRNWWFNMATATRLDHKMPNNTPERDQQTRTSSTTDTSKKQRQQATAVMARSNPQCGTSTARKPRQTNYCAQKS